MFKRVVFYVLVSFMQGAASMLVMPSIAQAENFIASTPLNNPSDGHSVTLLDDGTAIAIGFEVQVYDPINKVWALRTPMNLPRIGHTATLLNNGIILVAGGTIDFATGATTQTEIYNISTDQWTTVGALSVARFEHKATLLENGKLLVAGGADSAPSFTSLDSAELFDPVTNTWSGAGTLASGRYRHGQVLLENGEVLVAGGRDFTDVSALALSSAELYTPGTNSWRPAAAMLESHSSGSMVLLDNGQVLMATGTRNRTGSVFSTEDHPGAELYNPMLDSWSATGSLNTARRSSRATRLCDGSVLLTGGFAGANFSAPVTNSAELYSPGNGSWREVGPMDVERTQHTITLLEDCTALLVGGQKNGETNIVIASTSLYLPDAAVAQDMPCIPVKASNGNVVLICL